MILNPVYDTGLRLCCLVTLGLAKQGAARAALLGHASCGKVYRNLSRDLRF